MRRRPNNHESPVGMQDQVSKSLIPLRTGLVLSGGGVRAAYQVGALKALAPFIENKQAPIPFSVVIGSSIGAINGLLLSSGLKGGFSPALERVEEMWRKRTFRNTFIGSPSMAFFRAVKIAVMQYLSPGPNATSDAIFDPSPLMNEIDQVISSNGGLLPGNRHPELDVVGVMTTIEGKERKPMLFLSSGRELPLEAMHGASFQISKVSELSAKHGFASAALPAVLPPVELDIEGGRVRLVDGGISQNIPVDPAVRLGAERVIVVDVSGRDWWLRRYNEAQDTRPTWEVPAGLSTFCMRPPETLVLRCQAPLGPILRQTVGRSRAKFMAALGPVWPVFQLLKQKLGEEVAYEAVTYVALDVDYIHAVIEQGYSETVAKIKATSSKLPFERAESYEGWVKSL